MTLIITMIVAFVAGLAIPTTLMGIGAVYFKKHPEILVKAAAKKVRREITKAARDSVPD